MYCIYIGDNMKTMQLMRGRLRSLAIINILLRGLIASKTAERQVPRSSPFL
jgi:hypothetical protein